MIYDPDVYSFQKSNKDLEDNTDLFIERIEKYADMEGFGGIFWIIGQVGAGKSALLCQLIDLLLTYGYDRAVALYQAPTNLLESINASIPTHLKGKFRIIERLDEVHPYDVLALDEGYLSANAMNYLKTNEQNFINSLVTLRHSGVLSILGSQDDGILRKYRTKAQFKLYKSLTDGYIEETPKDKFAKKHQELLTTLKPQYTLFRITHPWFTTKHPIIRTGILDLPLKTYCSWFNDDISRNFEGETFDALLRKTLKIKQRAENVIRLLASKFGSKITINIAKGFLWDNHEKLYLEFKDEIPNLVNTIKSRYRLKQLEKLKYDGNHEEVEVISSSKTQETSETLSKITIPECSKQTSFPTYIYQFYKANLKTFKDIEQCEYEALIMYDWANGLSQDDTRYNRGGSPNTINKIIKKYRSGEKLANDQLRVGFILENYVAQITNAVREGGKSKPDLMYYENTKSLGPGEVKVVQPQSNADRIRFYLYSKNPNHHSLNPSFTYCLEHNIRQFPFFYYWPKWGTQLMMIPVTIPTHQNIEHSFFVNKGDYDEYKVNFETFNKFTFFYHP